MASSRKLLRLQQAVIPLGALAVDVEAARIGGVSEKGPNSFRL